MRFAQSVNPCYLEELSTDRTITTATFRGDEYALSDLYQRTLR